MTHRARKLSGTPDQLAKRLVTILQNYKSSDSRSGRVIDELLSNKPNLHYKNDLLMILALQKLKGDQLNEILYDESVDCNAPIRDHDNLLAAYMTVVEDDPDLHRFEFHSDISTIEALVGECEADVNVYNEDEKTPLILAVERPERREDYISVIQFFLDHGADVNKPDGDGQTPLIKIAQTGPTARYSISVARMLLDYGARVDIKDNYGKSAIDYATTKEMRFTLLKPMTSPGIRSVTKTPGAIMTRDYDSYIKAHGKYINNYDIGIDKTIVNKERDINVRVNTARRLVYLYTIPGGTRFFREGLLQAKLLEVINKAPKFGTLVVYSDSRYFSSSRLPKPGDTFYYPRIMSTTWNYYQVVKGLKVFVDEYEEKAGHCCILIINVKPPYLFIPDEFSRNPNYEEGEILITPRSFVVRKIGKTRVEIGEDARVMVTLYLDENPNPNAQDFFDPLIVEMTNIGAYCKNLQTNSVTQLKSLLTTNVDDTNFERVKRVFNYTGDLEDFSEHISTMNKKTLCNLMTRYYNET